MLGRGKVKGKSKKGANMKRSYETLAIQKEQSRYAENKER